MNRLQLRKKASIIADKHSFRLLIRGIFDISTSNERFFLKFYDISHFHSA